MILNMEHVLLIKYTTKVQQNVLGMTWVKGHLTVATLINNLRSYFTNHMGNFLVRYASIVVIYDRIAVIRLATEEVTNIATLPWNNALKSQDLKQAKKVLYFSTA